MRLNRTFGAEMNETPLTAGRLKARPLPLDTFRENIVVLSRDNAVLRPARLAGAHRLEVKSRGVAIIATPMIADDPQLVGADEIGLPQPAFRRLKIAAGDAVEIAPTRPPRSLEAVRAKIRGETLTPDRMAEVVADLVAHRVSDMEIAAFLIACASFMTADETLALTGAMVNAGARLAWGGRNVVDKHCIG